MEILIIFVIIAISIYKFWDVSDLQRHNIYLNRDNRWKNSVLQQNNIDLIESVTNLNRGNKAEHHLILSLLKLGIHPKAIYHDLYISKGNGKFSQIDLVVATKVGIIVFEVKDYTGRIYGNGHDNKWTQVLAYGKEKHRFYNPIKQNNTHIDLLKMKLKENVPFYSVIVFYGDSILQDVNFIPKGVFISKWYSVNQVIHFILTQNTIANYKNKYNVVKTLREAVDIGNDTRLERQHIENIKNMLGTDRIFH